MSKLLRRLGVWELWPLLLLTGGAQAQTLSEQYEYFLQTASPPNVFNDQRCLRLGLERNQATAQLAAGQVGPNLFQLCNGFPFIEQSPGASVPSVAGGGSGAAANRNGRSNDSALRRRRENARVEDDRTARLTSSLGGAASSDVESLFENGGVFMSYDHRNEKQAVTYYEDGRDGERKTLTLGADYRIGATILVGAALSYEELSGDFDSGGNFETRGYGGSFYGSWLPIDNLFVDFSGGYDQRDIETTRIVGRLVYFYPIGDPEPRIRISVPYAPVHGETDGRSITAEASAGYDFHIARFTVGPRIGAAYVDTVTDDYAENGESAMSLAFYKQKESSLQSSAGVQAGAAFTAGSIVIVPQANVNWIHEFRNDQRLIAVRFAEDLRPNPMRFGFLNQAPDRDVYLARVSAIAVLPGGFSAFAAVEKLFAHDYREQFGASIGVRWEM